MKETVKKFLPALLALILVLSAASGCRRDPDPQTPVTQMPSAQEVMNYDWTKEDITLLIDLHGYMPTINQTPTPDSPNVVTASRIIAEAFTKLYPNVTIEWARSKPVGGLEIDTSQWFITQIAGGSCPAIAFSWGTAYEERGYYLDLTDYLNYSNPYVEGYSTWKDTFEDYLFNTNTVKQADGKLVGIPVTLHAGAATGWYFNEKVVGQAGYTSADVRSAASNWESFLNLATDMEQKLDSDYTVLAPWVFCKTYSLNDWTMQFSIGPAAAAYLNYQGRGGVDYDGDGYTSTLEQLRGVKEGIYNPVRNVYAKDVYYQLKRYFVEQVKTDSGWLTADYTSKWNLGKVAFRSELISGLYEMKNDTAFDGTFGVVASPVMSNQTRRWVSSADGAGGSYTGEKLGYLDDIEYTESGVYQPAGDLILNIMKSGVTKKDGSIDVGMLRAAVEFLRFLTTPENVSMIVEENGAVLGAVKNTTYNSLLDEVGWMSQRFPKINGSVASWPLGFTSEMNDAMDRSFTKWVYGELSDDSFFSAVNSYQQSGADAYIQSFGIDTTGWTIYA